MFLRYQKLIQILQKSNVPKFENGRSRLSATPLVPCDVEELTVVFSAMRAIRIIEFLYNASQADDLYFSLNRNITLQDFYREKHT